MAARDDVLRPYSVDIVGNFCETGTVTHIISKRKFILERTDGQRKCRFTENTFGITPGSVAIVTGEVWRLDNGELHPHAIEIRRLSRKPLPAPVTTTLADISRQDLVYKSITVDGTLVLARRDEIDLSYLQLVILDGDALLNASINLDDVGDMDFTRLLGARLRLTGILLHSLGARRVFAPYLEIFSQNGNAEIKVLTPAPVDPFAVPRFDVTYPLTPAMLSSLGFRRFEGVVLATWGGNQLMLSDNGYHCVKATLALEQELPTVGTHVVVAGYPDTNLYGINLAFARCRRLEYPPAKEAAPQPITITLRDLLCDSQGRRRINGYSHGRLLRMTGIVLDIQPSLQMFSFHADGFTMPIDYSDSPLAFGKLEANSTVEIVALAVVESDAGRENDVLPQTRNVKLILRSADDLRVLARPPFWTPLKLFFVIVALLILIIVIVIVSRIVNHLVTRHKVEDRTQLAVELHDSLSQTLTGISCQIAAGRDAVTDDPQTATALLGAAERMLESSRTELKNCLFDLRNNTVDDPDFARAIERTLAIFKDETSVALRFPVERALLSDSTAHSILCMIRELVANAVRHGRAMRVRVAGAVDGKRLAFSVTDNGTGFDPANHPGPRDGHFGLTGIRERLSTLGGSMAIKSSNGKTRISITFQL